MLGLRIEQLIVRESRLRWPIDPDLPRQLRGQRIDRTDRRGKYLLLGLDSGDRLIIHLGMSGRLHVLPAGVAPSKHDHVDLVLANGMLLRYHDPRRFGSMLRWAADESSHWLIANLGPEPFSEAFNGDYLYRLSRGRSVAVKNFLMDGRVVVGAGNIYAAESLFRAGIRPHKAAGALTRPRYHRLAETVREVLTEAVAQGGTTLRDFTAVDGQPGYFQQDLYVYGRQGQPCRICTRPIVCSVIGQRSSFYCQRCQR